MEGLDHGVGRRRGDHELHEHVEPERDDRRRACWRGTPCSAASREAVGEDQPGARARWSSPSTCKAAGLLEYLAELGFNIVGYGCTTCIGNSGPLPEPVSSDRAGTRTSSSPRC